MVQQDQQDQRARTVGRQDESYRAWSAVLGMVVGAAGVWLLLSSTFLTYGDAGITAAAWNDRIAGPAVVIIALLRLTWPTDTRVFSVVNATIGGWLMLAPSVLGYDQAPRAARNDLVVGAVILTLAVATAWLLRATTRDRTDRSDETTAVG